VSRLLVVPQGVLRIDGSGFERFFALNADGTFATAEGDYGTLTSLPDGGYTYTRCSDIMAY
jgi:hypothetical protein